MCIAVLALMVFSAVNVLIGESIANRWDTEIVAFILSVAVLFSSIYVVVAFRGLMKHGL